MGYIYTAQCVDFLCRKVPNALGRKGIREAPTGSLVLHFYVLSLLHSILELGEVKNFFQKLCTLAFGKLRRRTDGYCSFVFVSRCFSFGFRSCRALWYCSSFPFLVPYSSQIVVSPYKHTLVAITSREGTKQLFSSTSAVLSIAPQQIIWVSSISILRLSVQSFELPCIIHPCLSTLIALANQ